jgi:hypothetical protein
MLLIGDESEPSGSAQRAYRPPREPARKGSRQPVTGMAPHEPRLAVGSGLPAACEQPPHDAKVPHASTPPLEQTRGGSALDAQLTLASTGGDPGSISMSSAARRVRTRRCARSRIGPAPANATIAAAAMLWPVFQHPQAPSAHADPLAVPAGWSGWPICVHLRARELRRPTIPFLPWPRRSAPVQRPRSRLPWAEGTQPAAPASPAAGQRRGGRAREALRVLTETQVPGPGRSLRHCPGHRPAAAGTGRRSRGQSG